MTNTRITDPEILEKRYPVSLERGTGGKGKFTGGDGVRRELMFRRNMTLSVLTERRVFSPYGMNGGMNGAKGQNLLKKKNKIINLGGKTTVPVEPGVIFCTAKQV
jgi:5-oxoprolinase (ATP-hydrolysing)